MRAAPLLALLVLAGCLQGTDPARPVEASDTTTPGIRLTEPVVLTAGAGGFEPSIAVGPDGTVYVTAATTRRPGETDPDHARLASWLWHSPDGETWSDLPSPLQAHEGMFGAEGDVAVDGVGRLYFVDTHLADNTLSRWSPTAAGPAWDFSRPLQGTASVVDDRPWLTAHGDGVVYLVSNNGAALPAPEDVLAGEVAPGARWLHRSEDGGVTWSLGHAFPDTGFCLPAADPGDDHDLIAVCNGDALRVHASRDRGRTWTTAFEAEYERGAAPLAPGAAVGRDGTRFAAWLDDRAPFSGVQDLAWEGDEPGRVLYAHAADGAAGDPGWRGPVDVTPFSGRFGMLHAAAGGAGVLAIAFYATPDLSPGDGSEWTPHLLLSTDAHADAPTWSHIPLLDGPAGTGPVPPRDFFQVAVGPDDAVHAALQRNREGQAAVPGDGIAADVLYRRTVAWAG